VDVQILYETFPWARLNKIGTFDLKRAYVLFNDKIGCHIDGLYDIAVGKERWVMLRVVNTILTEALTLTVNNWITEHTFTELADQVVDHR